MDLVEKGVEGLKIMGFDRNFDDEEGNRIDFEEVLLMMVGSRSLLVVFNFILETHSNPTFWTKMKSEIGRDRESLTKRAAAIGSPKRNSSCHFLLLLSHPPLIPTLNTHNQHAESS